jgi:glucosamine-phosphate N-acetyltransferase
VLPVRHCATTVGEVKLVKASIASSIIVILSYLLSHQSCNNISPSPHSGRVPKSPVPISSHHRKNIRTIARMAIISLQRPKQRDRITSQSRFIRAITNPDELLAELLPPPKKRDPNAKRFEDNKIARAIGGGIINYGIGGEPDYTKDLPFSDEPLAEVKIDPEIGSKLPRGYDIRSLRREDYDNGYLYLKNVGVLSREKWDERCEYLRARSDTYIVLVITNSENWVVCSGTLMVERKFTHDLCLVGHVEDLLIGEGQSGKNLGGRMLEALDQVSMTVGCYKTLVGTTEANESFHQERGEYLRWLLISWIQADFFFLAGFKRTGIDMSHHHFLPRKTVRPRDSSRDPSSDRFDYESVPEGDDKVASIAPVAVTAAPMVLAEPLPFESQAETCVVSVID